MSAKPSVVLEVVATFLLVAAWAAITAVVALVLALAVTAIIHWNMPINQELPALLWKCIWSALMLIWGGRQIYSNHRH